MANGESNFAYDPPDLDTLVKYISVERLAAYLAKTKASPERAVRLYERNTELSEALYGVVQAFEITLRNAIHLSLSRTHGLTWFESDLLLSGESEKESVTEAKRAIENEFEAVTPARVVAKLSLGFWVRLFSGEYDRMLWGPFFSKIFPMKLDRRAVYRRLIDIKTLRNRIAHHRRIIARSKTVAVCYDETLEAIGWLSPTVRLWVKQTNCFEERLARKFPPAKTPVPTEVQAADSPGAGQPPPAPQPT
ncbi:MAG: Abi family protein [Terracidiphilus sp.]